jgi:pimeloyl-ACP methyl ester carboxylesterase
MGELERSDDAVLPSVARFTRVCTCDRPDIRIGDDVTTPREKQPHRSMKTSTISTRSSRHSASPDRTSWSAHSYGGVIPTLFARTSPDTIGGLVMVDTPSLSAPRTSSPERGWHWDVPNAMTSPQVREGVQLIDAFARINAAPPMPDVPAVVLKADKPWRVDLLPPDAVTDDQETFDDWLASSNLLAADLGAEHMTTTNSGHGVYLSSPALVVDAVREVVDEAR